MRGSVGKGAAKLCEYAWRCNAAQLSLQRSASMRRVKLAQDGEVEHRRGTDTERGGARRGQASLRTLKHAMALLLLGHRAGLDSVRVAFRMLTHGVPEGAG